MPLDYEYVLSFDPGVSNGVALGRISEDTPYELVNAWQFRGGASALRDWIHQWWDVYYSNPNHLQFNTGTTIWDLTVISEKFTPLQGKGFSLTMDAVEPLRGEGVLIALDVMPDYEPGSKVWQRPNEMYFCGGSKLAEKKKLSRKFLKDTGNYRMPRVLGTPDSDDAMSATLHGIAYVMKTLKHKPTFDLISEWSENHDRISGEGSK